MKQMKGHRDADGEIHMDSRKSNNNLFSALVYVQQSIAVRGATIVVWRQVCNPLPQRELCSGDEAWHLSVYPLAPNGPINWCALVMA